MDFVVVLKVRNWHWEAGVTVRTGFSCKKLGDLLKYFFGHFFGYFCLGFFFVHCMDLKFCKVVLFPCSAL
jgi:hypothetical protein